MKSRILLFDLEVFPMLIAAWTTWEANALWVEKPTVICCFSAKWLGGQQITRGLPDYGGSEKKLIKNIWELLDEAEIVIAQNGDAFDIKMVNAQFIKYRMPPPSPYVTIDTLKAARRAFRFPSNKLDDLGDQLDEGRKLEHEGKGLWRKCMEGDKKAWAKMKKYNAQDVLLLERVYKRFIPWMKSRVEVVKSKKSLACPRCKSKKTQKRGKEVSSKGEFKRHQCLSCAKWFKIRIV